MKANKFVLLAAAAGCTLASQGLFAQAMEVVTVEAVREIVVGKSPIGAPIKELTIRSRVSYADLDLTTAEGAATLEKRVKDTAASSCKEIKVDVPVEGWTMDRCVREATDDAMVQVAKAIEAAKAAKK
ncbi:MAG: UrcA family protein [Gammaproteobacteria bacterium]|nr:UrcA family protein [Gammaproteobacteria bacterium]